MDIALEFMADNAGRNMAGKVQLILEYFPPQKVYFREVSLRFEFLFAKGRSGVPYRIFQGSKKPGCYDQQVGQGDPLNVGNFKHIFPIEQLLAHIP